MNTRFYTFTALFEKEPGTQETYNVSVPALPGCVTFGESKSEAESMIQEAMSLYLETFVEESLPIPKNKLPRKLKKDSYTKEFVVGIKQEIVIGFPVHETPRLTAS